MRAEVLKGSTSSPEGYGGRGDQLPVLRSTALARGRVAMRSEALAVSQEDGDESCSIIGSTLPSMPSDAGSSEPPKPWERREFKVTPGGSDRWRLDYWEEGWVIRVHGRKRQLPFSPVQRSCPCSREQLGEKRVTIVMRESQPIETIHDMWAEPRPWRRPGWKGYSFVDVKPGAILNEVDGPNGEEEEG